MKSPLPALLTLFFAAGPLAAQDAATKAAAPHVPFIEGRLFAEILKKAKEEGKPVMVDVIAVWCGPCKFMDRTTFADPGVTEWSKKNVIPVRVDAEKGEGRKLSAKYAVFSFPTVLFLDPNGHELDRLLGAFGAEDFKRGAQTILEHKSRLQLGLDALKQKWSTEEALSIATALGQRYDIQRMRPLVLRLVEEDPDLSRPEILQQFTALVILEDWDGKITPEVADLATTFLPRLGSDARRGPIAAALVREMARRGDATSARTISRETLAALGEKSASAQEILGALGNAEKKAGHVDAAVATFRKAVALLDAGALPAVQAERHMELAEGLAAAGRAAEAKSAMAAALQRAAADPRMTARAAQVELVLKAPSDALAHARRAVELSQGEDAIAQAALASALAASGDRAGAAAAWRKAGQIEPENPEYRRPLGASAREKGASKAAKTS